MTFPRPGEPGFTGRPEDNPYAAGMRPEYYFRPDGYTLDPSTRFGQEAIRRQGELDDITDRRMREDIAASTPGAANDRLQFDEYTSSGGLIRYYGYKGESWAYDPLLGTWHGPMEPITWCGPMEPGEQTAAPATAQDSKSALQSAPTHTTIPGATGIPNTTTTPGKTHVQTNGRADQQQQLPRWAQRRRPDLPASGPIIPPRNEASVGVPRSINTTDRDMATLRKTSAIGLILVGALLAGAAWAAHHDK